MRFTPGTASCGWSRPATKRTRGQLPDCRLISRMDVCPPSRPHGVANSSQGRPVTGIASASKGCCNWNDSSASASWSRIGTGRGRGFPPIARERASAAAFGSPPAKVTGPCSWAARGRAGISSAACAICRAACGRRWRSISEPFRLGIRIDRRICACRRGIGCAICASSVIPGLGSGYSLRTSGSWRELLYDRPTSRLVAGMAVMDGGPGSIGMPDHPL